VFSLRLTYVLAKRGPVVALVLALLALTAFGAAGWTATHPPTTEVTDQTNVQQAALDSSANATVTGNTSLYENGTVLHDPAVFPRSAPDLRVTPTARSGNASFEHVSQNVTLVYAATRNGETFWSRRVPLAAASANDTGALATPVAIDSERVRDRLRTFRRDVGDAGTVRATVRIDTTYRVAGYDGELSASAPLSFGENWYDVDDADASRSHDTPRERTVAIPSTRPVSPGALGGLGAVLSLVAGGVLLWYRAWRPPLSAVETDLHRHRYDEWISTGRLSLESGGDIVEVRTLEDLVDVAIDTNARVVHDPTAGCYVVLTEATRYQYVPARKQVG